MSGNNISTADKRMIARVAATGLVAGLVGGVGSILVINSTGNNHTVTTIPVTDTTHITKSQVVLDESSAVTDSVNKVGPAVVSITSTSSVQDFFGQIQQQTGAGTGFIITSDGLIVTNKHVVAGGGTYQVFTSDGKKYDATIVATDPLNDIAVLRIKATGLKTVELGSASDLKVGQWIVAIGNALGQFQNTVTVGVISAKNRSIQAGNTTGSSESLTGLLQTDAAINPGNSGGPLINLSGQVVGINTAVANANGIGFAIPIDGVMSAINSVEKTGKIVRPLLGVRYVPITTEVQQEVNLPVSSGVLVTAGSGLNQPAVAPGSPADKAGIVVNDIITKINNDAIDENNSLTSLLSKYNVGDTVNMMVIHGGKTKTVPVKLDQVQ